MALSWGLRRNLAAGIENERDSRAGREGPAKGRQGQGFFRA